MKTTKTRRLRLLLLWATLAVVFPAQAFYDPGVQRWINRDPIGETRGMNLYVFCGNNGIDRVDRLGLEIFPNGVPPPPTRESPCDKAITTAIDMMGHISNDARAHCIASCEIAKACGKLVCKCLGNAKESRDLGAGAVEWVCSWVLPKRAEEWLHDNIQGGNIDDSAADFAANDWGMDIAKSGGNCVKDCEARYGPEP